MIFHLMDQVLERIFEYAEPADALVMRDARAVTVRARRALRSCGHAALFARWRLREGVQRKRAVGAEGCAVIDDGVARGAGAGIAEIQHPMQNLRETHH